MAKASTRNAAIGSLNVSTEYGSSGLVSRMNTATRATVRDCDLSQGPPHEGHSCGEGGPVEPREDRGDGAVRDSPDLQGQRRDELKQRKMDDRAAVKDAAPQTIKNLLGIVDKDGRVSIRSR